MGENCQALIWNGRDLDEVTITGSIEVQSAIGLKLFRNKSICFRDFNKNTYLWKVLLIKAERVC